MSNQSLKEEFVNELHNVAISQAIGEAALRIYLGQIAMWWLEKMESEVQRAREEVVMRNNYKSRRTSPRPR